ncbi:hypothetical protein M378DRAFT_184250 [Amanita muscaria Koide BX008]|uniref:Carbonic anhydrase n=1 Tax=Amanita muscaria (strain Koide BX008) TaxID=946122 RepID=A0A0C2XLA8_AMAMK|nr:hypothetical protein M378DRAFT_184250 [Amanita muscaria Koide BX008]
MADQLPTLSRLLVQNATWARDVKPDFLEQSARGQQPHTLWIGCSDSRVPESVITNSRPGDIFVHRNIANQLHLDDINVLSVIAYAVDYLHVQHVVVVGHSECGGAAACLGAAQSLNYTGPSQTVPDHPADHPLNVWLAPLTELVASLNISTLDKKEALALVVEENVRRQVDNLSQTPTVKHAWERGQKVSIHGWVYDLSTGLLKDLEISRTG